MAVNYSTTVKNSRLTVVRDAIDGGPAAGKLKIYTAGYGAMIAEFTLSDPCGTVAAGVLTFSGMPKTTTGTGGGGTAAIARLTDSTDAMVAEGLTVGLAATDIIIDNTSIAAGQTVNLNSGSITHG